MEAGGHRRTRGRVVLPAQRRQRHPARSAALDVVRGQSGDAVGPCARRARADLARTRRCGPSRSGRPTSSTSTTSSARSSAARRPTSPILDDDPLTVDPMAIRDIGVWGTVVGGRPVSRQSTRVVDARATPVARDRSRRERIGRAAQADGDQRGRHRPGRRRCGDAHVTAAADDVHVDRVAVGQRHPALQPEHSGRQRLEERRRTRRDRPADRCPTPTSRTARDVAWGQAPRDDLRPRPDRRPHGATARSRAARRAEGRRGSPTHRGVAGAMRSSHAPTASTVGASHRSSFVMTIRSAPASWRTTSPPTYRSVASVADRVDGRQHDHATRLERFDRRPRARPRPGRRHRSPRPRRDRSRPSATRRPNAWYRSSPSVQHAQPFGRFTMPSSTCPRQPFGIDADAAEVVDDHADPSPARIGQQPVEHGGLARAEIPAEHGERDPTRRPASHRRVGRHQSTSGGAPATKPPASSALSTMLASCAGLTRVLPARP